MTYISTKSYGHDVGLSCSFRQWRASHSHCQYLHGYALSIRLEFEADRLDERNWVIDFGDLKDLKKTLQDTYDHKTVVAADDPHMAWFRHGQELKLLDLVVVDSVGCEAFARHVWTLANDWLVARGQTPRCRVSRVEVCEHGANSAIYCP
jgi:6-pyruvoyltetrahydropterin/6-carboxytetrahydropterin synthase